MLDNKSVKYIELTLISLPGIQMHYEDLARSECHPHISLLICSTLFPACTPGYDITLPCHDFCEEVKESCMPFVKKARIAWPFYFDCLGLPRRKRGRFCINEKFEPADLEKIRTPDPPDRDNDVEEDAVTTQSVYFTDPQIKNFGLELVTTPPANRKDAKTYVDCPEPILFSLPEQSTARVWIMAWSSVALSLSFVMLFLVTSYGKIQKPENIIVTMNCCFLFQAAGFLLAVVAPQPPFQCSVQESPADPLYLKTSSASPTCLISFSAVYFSNLAANLWWVTLNLLWFLMLGMNWSHESIFKVFRYLHLVIGSLAGGLTITVLTVGAVEGDDLSGGCFAGGVDPQNLATYDITPNCVLLSIGAVVLVCGSFTLYKISKIDGYKHTMEIPLDRLKKTTVFSYLYLLVSLVKILCQFYELTYRADWYENCDPNRNINFSNLEIDEYPTRSNSSLLSDNSGTCGPDYRIFMLKYTCYFLLPILVAFYLKTTVSLLDIVKRLVPIAKGYTRRAGETKV